MMISIAWKGQTNRWMWASLFSAMTILLPVMSARGEIQNDAVGFSTNHVLESAQAGENVDVMTGNLTLTIPLGPRYKLTDRFSYGVTLTYNSKVWEHDYRSDADKREHRCAPLG
jgi:hypothetical protein